MAPYTDAPLSYESLARWYGAHGFEADERPDDHASAGGRPMNRRVARKLARVNAGGAGRPFGAVPLE